MSLPDIDKVREHEAKGGLWRYVLPNFPPSFVCLFVSMDDEIMYHRGFAPARAAIIMAQAGQWTPCTPDGDPLHLVEHVANLEELMASVCLCFAARLRGGLERDIIVGPGVRTGAR